MASIKCHISTISKKYTSPKGQIQFLAYVPLRTIKIDFHELEIKVADVEYTAILKICEYHRPHTFHCPPPYVFLPNTSIPMYTSNLRSPATAAESLG